VVVVVGAVVEVVGVVVVVVGAAVVGGTVVAASVGGGVVGAAVVGAAVVGGRPGLDGRGRGFGGRARGLGGRGTVVGFGGRGGRAGRGGVVVLAVRRAAVDGVVASVLVTPGTVVAVRIVVVVTGSVVGAPPAAGMVGGGNVYGGVVVEVVALLSPRISHPPSTRAAPLPNRNRRRPFHLGRLPSPSVSSRSVDFVPLTRSYPLGPRPWPAAPSCGPIRNSHAVT
jgi:hypothetical protein